MSKSVALAAHTPGEPAARLLPPARRDGSRIGLLGGSFNPPHEGHRLASLTALNRLGLDRVWWLVTPGNPLKHNDSLPPLDERIAAARLVAAHPRIDVTGLELAVGSSFTRDTIAWLRRRQPGVRFVWLMGADNLTSFHRWRRWRDIAGMTPVAVIDRPASTLRSIHSRAGVFFAASRLPERDAHRLPASQPPAFVFLHGPRSALSSTGLRAAQNNSAPGDG